MVLESYFLSGFASGVSGLFAHGEEKGSKLTRREIMNLSLPLHWVLYHDQELRATTLLRCILSSLFWQQRFSWLVIWLFMVYIASSRRYFTLVLVLDYFSLHKIMLIDHFALLPECYIFGACADPKNRLSKMIPSPGIFVFVFFLAIYLKINFTGAFKHCNVWPKLACGDVAVYILLLFYKCMPVIKILPIFFFFYRTFQIVI